MTILETWLKQATRHLSRDSTAQVRREIQEHYESAFEAGIAGGASAEEADRLAVIALGHAKNANRQYRKVLLTSAEARMLREGNFEARAVCSRPWLRWLFLVMPIAAVFVDSAAVARVLLAGGIAMGLLFAAPLLPVYTPSRGRIFRGAKWIVLVATIGLAFGADALKWSWLLSSCLWLMVWIVWIEWTRVSIRRKLPVADWPKQLYL
jgi:hypothetical protein